MYGRHSLNICPQICCVNERLNRLWMHVPSLEEEHGQMDWMKALKKV
jgi:hypothetical protein